MIQEEILRSGRDTVLVGGPLLLLLFAGFFRLDELLLRPRKKQGSDAQGNSGIRRGRRFCSEPDGTPLLPASHSVKGRSK